ncbi:MAG: hypothetical protein ACOWWO_03095 [Peptococcaceae bacterium]
MPQVDKENLKEQMGNIENMMKDMKKNMKNPLDKGNDMPPLYGMQPEMGNMMNPMMQQMNMMMYNMMQMQRMLQDIYFTVHETHRAVLEIKHRLEL